MIHTVLICAAGIVDWSYISPGLLPVGLRGGSVHRRPSWDPRSQGSRRSHSAVPAPQAEEPAVLTGSWLWFGTFTGTRSKWPPSGSCSGTCSFLISCQYHTSLFRSWGTSNLFLISCIKSLSP